VADLPAQFVPAITNWKVKSNLEGAGGEAFWQDSSGHREEGILAAWRN
jgi:hypothetical protein